MGRLEESRSESFERAMHRTLTSTEDYVRRIHWWVRLFGVVWIVLPIIATVFAVVFMMGALVKSNTG